MLFSTFCCTLLARACLLDCLSDCSICWAESKVTNCDHSDECLLSWCFLLFVFVFKFEGTKTVLISLGHPQQPPRFLLFAATMTSTPTNRKITAERKIGNGERYWALFPVNNQKNPYVGNPTYNKATTFHVNKNRRLTFVCTGLLASE